MKIVDDSSDESETEGKGGKISEGIFNLPPSSKFRTRSITVTILNRTVNMCCAQLTAQNTISILISKNIL